MVKREKKAKQCQHLCFPLHNLRQPFLCISTGADKFARNVVLLETKNGQIKEIIQYAKGC